MINILIADDHPIFRDGLRRVLEAEPEFRVVGEAANGTEAVNLARQLNPDVLLLDLVMPQSSGIEALRELSNLPSPVRTIVLTAEISKSQIIEAIQLGARGVVLKGSTSELLIESIRSVMEGQFWVGQENVSDLVQVLRRLLPHPGEKAQKQKFGLTPRELQIITVIVAGYSNKEIALKYSLSEQTVKHHITNILDKLGVSNRLEIALFAVNHRLIDDL